MTWTWTSCTRRRPIRSRARRKHGFRSWQPPCGRADETAQRDAIDGRRDRAGDARAKREPGVASTLRDQARADRRRDLGERLDFGRDRVGAEQHAEHAAALEYAGHRA